jgi:hypothetical protein
MFYFMLHPDSEMKELSEEELVTDLSKSGYLSIK